MATVNNSKLPAGPNTRSIFRWWLRESAACLFWLAVVSALFGCPLWSHVASNFATLTNQWALAISLMAFGLVWLFCGNRAIWVSAFVAGYPLVLLFRYLPRMFMKHWPVLVVFLPGIRSILVTFRRRVAIGSLAIAAAIIAVSAKSPTPQLLAWWALIGYLAWHYFQRFYNTYQATTVYSQLADMLERTSSWFPDSKTIKNRIREQNKSSDQKPIDSAVEHLVFYATSTALHYVACKLDRLHKSSKLDLYLAASAVLTILINISVFAIIYAGMHQQSPNNFQVSQNVGGFDFFIFSFCNHFMSDVSSISPSSEQARFFCVVQQAYAVLAALLVGLVFFTSCRERHSRDLELVVSKFSSASNAIGTLFERDYRMTLAAVEDILLSYSPDITRWLINVRYGEKKAQRMIKDFEDQHAKKNAIAVPPTLEVETIQKAAVSAKPAPLKKRPSKQRKRKPKL